MIDVKLMRVGGGEGLELPAYATSGAAGLDLRAAQTVRLKSGSRFLMSTGIAIALPPLHEAQVRPRSGLAVKHGVTVLNSPGTIDEDYRGEIQVILINHGTEDFVINRGDRIAQLVIAAVTKVHLVEVQSLSETARGVGGHGSTGTS